MGDAYAFCNAYSMSVFSLVLKTLIIDDSTGQISACWENDMARLYTSM
jgi:hypothetical protein